MSDDSGSRHRSDIRRALERDFSRHARREQGHRTFWQSLGVLGMVGWPISLAAVGGALLGRYLDARFGSGVRFTLMLLTAGAMLGSYTAWRSLKGRSG
jgi:ATP synthase protein I